MAIPKRYVVSKVCVLQFSIFSCAHLGSSARNLSKRPKWDTYVEVIYLCAFQGTFGVFSPILLFFARHDVKWRPCISTLRPIDIMTQVCYEGTYFGAQNILDPANNSSWAWRTVAAMLAIWDYPKSWAHLATLPFPKPEELGDAQKMCWTHMT